LENPELLSLEVMTPEMFRKALNLYFEALDLYNIVLAWRFLQPRESVKRLLSGGSRISIKPLA